MEEPENQQSLYCRFGLRPTFVLISLCLSLSHLKYIGVANAVGVYTINRFNVYAHCHIAPGSK